MSSNIINEDLRSIKTRKAIYSAMFSLLKNIGFRKITIKGICEEALISRAAFYAHFIDKYDLLKYWITEELWPKDISGGDTYEQLEKTVNRHIQENASVLKNLVLDADNETLGIIFDFLLSTINLTVKRDSERIFSKDVVVSNFFAGGIISYFLWQVKNRFPSDVPPMNKYLYEIISEFKDRQAK